MIGVRTAERQATIEAKMPKIHLFLQPIIFGHISGYHLLPLFQI
jgi:hypothetical protein